MSIRIRRFLLASTACLAALLASADVLPARAGTYPLYSCDYPGSAGTGQKVWSVAFGSEATVSCPSFTGWGAGGISAPYTAAVWRTTAPTGPIAIQSLELTGSLRGGAGNWEYFIPQANAAICPGTSNRTCSGSPLTPSVTMPAGTKVADIQIRCPTGGECNGWDASFKPKLTLSENYSPSASITGGSLVGGGAQSGARTLTWDAADAESGVARTKVTLGGVTVYETDHTATSSCKFDTWSPCASSQPSNGPVSIDTTRAPNGAQPLVLTIADAAGNAKTDTRSVDVCNACQPTTSTSGSGSSGAATSMVASPFARTLNGGAEGKTLFARFAGSRTRITVSYGRSTVIAGRLVAASGAAVANAKVDVQTATRVAGATFHPTTVLTTDADGRFRFSLRARSSRLVRFAYRTYFEDLAPAQLQEVELRVRAPISLGVSHRSTRNGRSVHFSGRIRGVASSSRKAVEMQAQVRKRWVSFGTARLSNGRFRLGYRFARTYHRTTYTFRAVVRSDGRWPFETTGSKRVRVVVRP